ncbi:hypothetical protein [Glaciimonas immobilis]|uniref:Uncharacterized protein n=1 Tax=Glaciimonas immobilis TaxID=728004 RepID=A0A840RSL2_9BURK|nr:hypothetical protein [Glaciimonas immobilis]KAF3997646.1 hypothetical protein HAV38_13360 [Glaciimonas immobilis]MBB5200643.1 hypothetical protein [Glaciimonas immobilis]
MYSDINWKEAPQSARWWAMDANGYAHWFLAPSVVSFTDFWFAEEIPAPRFGYTGAWQTSLSERPASEKQEK